MAEGLAKGFGVGVSRWVAACAALACLGAAPWDLPSVSGVAKVRFGGDRNQTRIVVELDRSARGRVLEDGADRRLVLALPGVGVSGQMGGAGQGLVASWTVDRVAGAAAIEVSLTRPARVVRRFVLAPSEGSPNYRYVIDVAATGPAEPAAPSAPSLVRAADTGVIHARKVIVVDAGHGGKDPGALGANSSHEKDLTLAAAKALKKRLERDGRYFVVLTRRNDVFVPLQERVQIARRSEADLFISLHADAGSDPGLRGATVYTLSDKGSDRVARNVIDRDNWIDVSMPSRDQQVNRILLDLTQRVTRNQSSAFAETLVDHVGEQTTLLQHSHRDAGYVVLLAPDVPAVLLEMGFITNPQDEGTLVDPDRRARLMDAVGDSIDDYFAGQRRYAAR